MIKVVPFVLLLSFFSFSSVKANNYFTPGSGVNWTLDDLVTNSGGDVTFSNGSYMVNDTIFISKFDTLVIATDATVKFVAKSYMDVNGTLLINPPNNVLFTAADIPTGYYGLRIDSSSTTTLRKLTLEYAGGLRITDCNPSIDSCIFRFNTPSTTFASGAINLFRSNPVITNTQFLNNLRPAIIGGGNISNAPKVNNCTFIANCSTANLNQAQINLGATGSTTSFDTAMILNSTFIGGQIKSGGIAFFPVGGVVYAVVSGNIIRKNRYGVTYIGGSAVNSITSYNVIDTNNIENDPNLGGSGIAFSGGSTTSHQNSIVTGNIFRNNLWGVTILNGSKPNLGNLENTDTTDDGKNYFINNTNANTPNIDLYNNSADNIMAQGNYWGSDDAAVVESHIFHQPDNSALGLVNYAAFITLPVQLINFNASFTNQQVALKWQTSSENNSHYFSVERSIDGKNFSPIGSVAAAGNSTSARQYGFTDKDLSTAAVIYYRLQLFDKDGRSTYSQVLPVRRTSVKQDVVKCYPTVLDHSQTFTAELSSQKNQLITVRVSDTQGRLLFTRSVNVQAGTNVFTIEPEQQLANGILYVSFSGDGIQQTVRLLKQ
jgi:hypothetical protein